MEKINPKDKQDEFTERRSYIRLKVVFPVEFQFLDPETGGSISDIKQGFTRDIGKGGICLEVNNIEEGFEQLLKEGKVKLDLNLHIPLAHRETRAQAKVIWNQKIKSGYPNKYLIGVSFLQIEPKERNRIYFHAKKIVLIPRFIAVLFLSLAIGIVYFNLNELKLKIENKKLVEELVKLSDKKSELEKNLLKWDSERKDMEGKLKENNTRIEEYKGQFKDIEKLSLQLRSKEKLVNLLKEEQLQAKAMLKKAILEKSKFSKKVKDINVQNEYFKNKISKISKESFSAEDELKNLVASFEDVEEKNIGGMYKWIKNHQDKRTGLVISYEGDRSLEEWAFTYDQSLASQCFTLIGDQNNAKEIMDFYKNRAEKTEGAFTNAYDSSTGKILEYSVHAGPNIWLGVAILQYTNKFKDETYLSLAEGIAEWLIKLQREDKEFGIRGGPKFTWFSTEHNLDAYAFFGMLYGITEDEKYLQAQNRTFEWIRKNAFNTKENRLNRGKGDATIATDTFAWAIAAIGPELLNSIGMDPEQIIDFAEANCVVTVDYLRPDGEKVKITGFDFGKYEHLARGAIVSTEWTAQMVGTLRIMADYYKEKDDFQKSGLYKRKSDFYLSELEKMVIISPSRIGQGEGCLPYATQDNIDTGHGWRVARGTRTGSTAGTAYTIFAKYNYNPLKLD